jgi:catechol 2,3-dioxygenase-like lactoylglutathione lyase family enzyme
LDRILTSKHTRHAGVTTVAHIGLVAEDLDETIRFLSLLGLECGEPETYTGKWTDRIMGLEKVTAEVVMARAPDGSDVFEVLRFRSPARSAEGAEPASNRPGLRHIAFNVDDVRGVVDRLAEAGWGTVGEVVGSESTSLYCYVRGPDGLIVELAGGPTG